MIENGYVSHIQPSKNITGIDFAPKRFVGFIEEIKSSSSTGPDGIIAKMMKGGKYSMKSGVFPEKLKIMFILGLYKGGDKSSPSQYRPITLSSHLAKTI